MLKAIDKQDGLVTSAFKRAVAKALETYDVSHGKPFVKGTLGLATKRLIVPFLHNGFHTCSSLAGAAIKLATAQSHWIQLSYN